jgi:hypothetical protein
MPPSFAGSCFRVEREFKATGVLPVSFRQGGSASRIETIVRAKRDAGVKAQSKVAGDKRI